MGAASPVGGHEGRVRRASLAYLVQPLRWAAAAAPPHGQSTQRWC